MHFDQEKFDAKRTVYVQRAFKGHGHVFLPGDVFPWRKMAMSHRRMSQLFFKRLLTHGDRMSDELKTYNPAEFLLELGFTPEQVKADFTKEQVKAIHATKTRGDLTVLLEQFKLKAEEAEAEKAKQDESEKANSDNPDQEPEAESDQE